MSRSRSRTVIYTAAALAAFTMSSSSHATHEPLGVEGGSLLGIAKAKDLHESTFELEYDDGLLDVSPPVPEDCRVTSPYGWRQSRRTGRRTFHAGVDFGAARGRPVLAVRRGTVALVALESERSNGMGGYGNAVVVYHEDEDRWSLYAHLHELTVEEGQGVDAGDQLGTVGNTSNRRFPRMGVHLHFEIRERPRNGDAPFPGPYRLNNENPRSWLADHGVVYDRRGNFVHPDPEPPEAFGEERASAETTRIQLASLADESIRRPSTPSCLQAQTGMCGPP